MRAVDRRPPGTLRVSLVTLTGAVLLAGCAGRGGEIPYNVSTFGAPDAPIPTEADHRISAGDVVNVTVYQVPSLSGDQPVDGVGNITMPLIGAVPARGKTTAELADTLKNRLGAKYIQSPQVIVTLKAVVQQTITVDGSVTQPGIYPIGAKTTLLQAVSLARGTKEGANPKRVVIFRQINGQRQAAAFDLTTIRKGQEPDPEVFGSDVIVVDGSGVKDAFRSIIQSVPLLTIFRPF